MEKEQALTPKDIAHYLDVNVETIKRLLRTGKLKGFKVGVQWRVWFKDLKEYLGD
jgi:excisionase family DNA binding protein